MVKLFSWGQDYFVARVLLGFSEDEFWQSTPRTIYLLKHYYDKHFNIKSPQNNKTQINELLTLFGKAPLL